MDAANDPLYARLLTISAMIEAGDAEPLTVQQWDELRDVVTVIMDAARDQADSLARALSSHGHPDVRRRPLAGDDPLN